MTDSFSNRLAESKTEIFLAVDGAKLKDANVFFESNSVHAFSLFKETAPVALRNAGPWIFSGGSTLSTIQNACRFADSCGGAVVWVYPDGRDALRRHLRTLNAIKMPDETLVFFRHYDPDVMAFLAPLLDAEQVMTVFGDAHLVALIGGRGDGALIDWPAGLPRKQIKPNILCLYDWQLVELNNRQRDLSRVKILKFMREKFPAELSSTSDSMLLDELCRCETTAKTHGVKTERGIAQWMHLNILSDGRFERNEYYMNSLLDRNEGSADEILRLRFRDIAARYHFERNVRAA